MTTVQDALSAVMGDVQAVRKGDRNTQQGFNFRGIDSVVNAVGPALRKHGLVFAPSRVVSIEHERYDTAKGTSMDGVTVVVEYTITGPEGDSMTAAAAGQASDSGDKAVPKAMSVAYRTVLLQALCIPTDEPDPDAQAHERAGRQHDPRLALFSEVKAAGHKRGMSDQETADDFAAWSQGTSIRDATAEQLTRYTHHLNNLEPVK